MHIHEKMELKTKLKPLITMSKILGIDTSNYTTSVAVLDTDDMSILHKRKLLPVKSGGLGLRQSDAVFHHTKQLPEMITQLMAEVAGNIDAVSVSIKPRCVEGSYMPCFLVGEGLAISVGSLNKIPVYKTSHQVGHILAGLVSNDNMSLLKSRFMAFHCSGGTTDLLLCEPSASECISITEIGSSLDLKAGQAIDRVGLMLGLRFPCGVELEKLALRSSAKNKIKTSVKDCSCSLSGVENKCKKMLEEGFERSDIALFCLDFIYASIRDMTTNAFKQYGKMPMLFVGGVMSDLYIRKKLENDFDCTFAKPEYSSDNAVGTAVFGALQGGFI